MDCAGRSFVRHHMLVKYKNKRNFYRRTLLTFLNRVIGSKFHVNVMHGTKHLQKYLNCKLYMITFLYQDGFEWENPVGIDGDHPSSIVLFCWLLYGFNFRVILLVQWLSAKSWTDQFTVHFKTLLGGKETNSSLS